MAKLKALSAVVSSEIVLRRRKASIVRIVISCMGWMNGWSATQEAERESADKAAKRIMRMVAKWKSQNDLLSGGAASASADTTDEPAPSR